MKNVANAYTLECGNNNDYYPTTITAEVVGDKLTNVNLQEEEGDTGPFLATAAKNVFSFTQGSLIIIYQISFSEDLEVAKLAITYKSDGSILKTDSLSCQ